MDKERGKFIVIEGIDGSGKTTQAKLLVSTMGNNTVYLNNKTDTSLGKYIIEVLKPENFVSVQHMASLFLASMYEINIKIKDYLDNGINVVCDRWYLSTMIYGTETPVERHAVLELSLSLVPVDYLILLDIEPELSMKRIVKRNDDKSHYDNFGTLQRYHKLYKDLTLELSTNRDLFTFINIDCLESDTVKMVHFKVLKALKDKLIFSHKELGYTDEWLLEKIERTKEVDFTQDFLNEFIPGSGKWK